MMNEARMRMNLDDIGGLYYITHVDNIESICRLGILSHASARRLPHTSISKSEVIDIRTKRRVPPGKPLLEYVNLYFNPRNPMMYKVTDAGRNVGNVCLLKICKQILASPGVIITDGNAASGYTRFYASPSGLAALNKDEVFVEFWNDDDPLTRFRLRSRTCSEVLVPECIDKRYLEEIILPSDALAESLRGRTGNIMLRIDKTPFFG